MYVLTAPMRWSADRHFKNVLEQLLPLLCGQRHTQNQIPTLRNMYLEFQHLTPECTKEMTKHRERLDVVREVECLIYSAGTKRHLKIN